MQAFKLGIEEHSEYADPDQHWWHVSSQRPSRLDFTARESPQSFFTQHLAS